MGTDPKGPKAEQRPEIKPGDLVLDRYQVVEQIASGGHSVVFLGKDVRLSRPVCIKVFSGLGGKSGVGRTSYEHFVQEAFALSRLTHPNTLRIYDFGHLGSKDVEGMPLQVCEYMSGGTLSNLVREKGKQGLPETARVVAAMCAALSEAHGLGIVHRDIKPQNILFGSVGVSKLPKLADFGIAKWSADEPDENRAEDTQIVAGQKLAMYSPSWAAPEQLAGQPVSAATDIYSLAVVAIYMLSGRAIFADEDVYAGYKKRRHADEHVRDALVPLKISKTVIALLVKALAFDPKKRITKVDELASGLMDALEPKNTLEMPPLAVEVATPTVPHDALPATDEQKRAPTTSDGEPEITVEPTPPPIAPVEGPKPRPTPRAKSPAPQMPMERPVVSAETMESMGYSHAPTAAMPREAAVGTPPPTPPPVAPAPPPRTAAPMPAAQPITGNSQHSPLSHSAPPALSGWQAPVVRPPWMNTQPAAAGQIRWLGPAEYPHQVSERRVHFVLTPQHVVDLTGGQGKVRVTLMTSTVGARLVHLKGLTCFVAILGGRPSPAVQLDQPSDIALVTPRAQEIGHIRVAVGSQQADGHRVFPLGMELIGVSVEDCSDPILFDFGPGFDAYFVYTRGRPVPVPVPTKPPRRR